MKAQNTLGYLLVIIGLICFINPFSLLDSMGHYIGLLGFAFIFIGITLLKKRKDQLAKQSLTQDQ